VQNADRVKGRVRDYREANRQAVAERKRLAHLTNRETDNARYRQWMAANPEKAKANTARMRARRRGAPGRFTAKDVAAQYARQRGTCFYCPQSLAGGNFQVDHHIPLSRGGDNDPSNIVLACPGCNRAKGTKLPWEFQAPKE
jgi:5-methylcytosine-specific restriction endonuclease McrA